MCLLGFSGFLRFNDLSSNRLCGIKWKEGYIELKIPKSKPDIYRKGNVITIAKLEMICVPFLLLCKYISFFRLSVAANDYLFTAINVKKFTGAFKV